MSKALVNTIAVFCIALGVTYGASKLFRAPPELMYLAPTLALIYLGFDILFVRRASVKARPRVKK